MISNWSWVDWLIFLIATPILSIIGGWLGHKYIRMQMHAAEHNIDREFLESKFRSRKR